MTAAAAGGAGRVNWQMPPCSPGVFDEVLLAELPPGVDPRGEN
jgi:hypothetical protein